MITPVMIVSTTKRKRKIKFGWITADLFLSALCGSSLVATVLLDDVMLKSLKIILVLAIYCLFTTPCADAIKKHGNDKIAHLLCVAKYPSTVWAQCDFHKGDQLP